MSPRALLLPRYEAIATSSASMLDAARSGAWEDLVRAEQACAAQIRELQAIETQAQLRGDAAANRDRIHILRRILAHDAEIRSLTQSWLRGLEQLLRSTGLDRMVRSTYGNPHSPPPPLAG